MENTILSERDIRRKLNNNEITKEEAEAMLIKLREMELARSEFIKNNSVHFGNYYTSYGVPSIEIINPDGSKAYLSAFRRYSFQVSGTRDGEWSRGATPVFGLETLTSIRQIGPSNLSQHSTEIYIIGAIAMQAVCDYCCHESLYPPTEIYNYVSDNEEWKKFLENVRKFAAKRDDVDIVNDDHVKKEEKEEETTE